MKNVLTIAGSDPSGGAGIQADLKTMCALGVFGMSAITAVTVQNTQKVYDVQELRPDIVAGQIDAVYGDIPVAAVKIGMVSNAEIARAIAEGVKRNQAANIVLDPVMVSKSGCRLLREDAEREIKALIPLAEVVTPNLLEAALLAGMEIREKKDMITAAENIRALGARGVLVKGGLSEEDSDDYLLQGDKGTWMTGPRIHTKNTHGSGCTLSSAIACFLAMGLPLGEAIGQAKGYVTQAIRDSLDVGKGTGPLGHLVALYRKAGMTVEE